VRLHARRPGPASRPAARPGARLGALVLLALASCSDRGPPAEAPEERPEEAPKEVIVSETPTTLATATFGGGCFWCLDAVFRRLDGVADVACGYAGGTVESPTYEQVCRGTTGHAEVVRIRFDPARIAYTDLLDVFFRIHDPTTPNRQGADFGPQYRSLVLTHDDGQARAVAEKIRALDEAGAFSDPIVTEVAPAGAFHPAEAYHQDYFARNPAQGYCRAVIAPKVEKFERAFPDRLRRR
jgi:peptide-methionine (S)-S-oxide reductase